MKKKSPTALVKSDGEWHIHQKNHIFQEIIAYAIICINKVNNNELLECCNVLLNNSKLVNILIKELTIDFVENSQIILDTKNRVL